MNWIESGINSPIDNDFSPGNRSPSLGLLKAQSHPQSILHDQSDRLPNQTESPFREIKINICKQKETLIKENPGPLH
jgi:hypothetical protein